MIRDNATQISCLRDQAADYFSEAGKEAGSSILVAWALADSVAFCLLNWSMWCPEAPQNKQRLFTIGCARSEAISLPLESSLSICDFREEAEYELLEGEADLLLGDESEVFEHCKGLFQGFRSGGELVTGFDGVGKRVASRFRSSSHLQYRLSRHWTL